MGKKAAEKRLAKSRSKSGVSDTPERQKMEEYFAGKKGAVDDVSDDDITAIFLLERHGLSLGVALGMLREKKCSPLHFATMSVNFEAAKALIESGAALERKDNAKQTPLHIAARYDSREKDNFEIAKLLLDNGAKIDVKDFQGWTPLHYAAIAKRENLVALFLERGANEALKSDEGKTASDLSDAIRKVKADKQARMLADSHGITLDGRSGRGGAL